MLYSIYSSVNQTASAQTVSLSEIVDIIRQPNDVVKKIRTLSPAYVATGDKTLKKTLGSLKAALPYITAAGVFSERNNAGLKEYSGVVQLDIDIKHPDGLNLINDIKRIVASQPYVSIAFISPSGYGVKALAHTTNTNPEHHSDAVKQLCEVIEDAIYDVISSVEDKVKGKIVDDCAKALSQPCYLSYDPDVYYNPEHTQWEYVYVEPEIVVKPIVARTGIVEARSDSHQEKILTRYINRNMLIPGTQNSTKLIGFANSVGIEREVLRDFMLADTWAYDDIARIDYIYDKYADQWGSMAGERIVEAPVPVVMEVMNQDTSKKTITLEKGQYLSDVIDGRTITKNTNIIAPTGSGKTHLVFDGPQVWVFPTTALCYQFWVKHQTARTVWGDAPNIDGDTNFIITTYDSCAKAMQFLNIQEYTVILDEFHNYTVSSAPGYKLKALRSTLPFVLIAKKVITLTATPFYHEISEFQGFDTIEVKNAGTFTRKVQLLKSEESRRNDVIRSITSRANFSLIFLQTTDKHVLDAWEHGLNDVGYEVVFINSTTKDDDCFTEIVSNSSIRSNCVYISTSVIAEGVSITTELDVVDVYIMGAQHPYIIEQMARRFRKINTLNVFLLTNSEEGDSDIKTLAQVEVIGMSYREELKSAAQRMVEQYEESGIKMEDFNITGFPIYADGNGWYVDELLIEYQTFRKVCDMFFGNIKLTLESLVSEYGYVITEEINGKESATMHVKRNVNADKMTIARDMAMDVIFGNGIELSDDAELMDLFQKSTKVLRRICNNLPGIKKLGKEKLADVMTAFDAWGNNKSARFITYVKLLNSGIDDREVYRNKVVELCLAENRSAEELIKLGGMVFATEYVSASDKQKMELLMSIMMGYDSERTMQDGEKVYVFTPSENRLQYELELAQLNIFNY